MKTKFVALICTAGIATAPIAANAQETVDATQPDEILNIATGFGSARMTEDNIGDPLIVGRIDGVPYSISFWGCEDNASCKEIQFWAGWRGTDVTLAEVNQWNNDVRLGTAYIDDEGDPILTFGVNLYGGVTYDNIDDTFEWWEALLMKFVDEVLGTEGEVDSGPI